MKRVETVVDVDQDLRFGPLLRHGERFVQSLLERHIPWEEILLALFLTATKVAVSLATPEGEDADVGLQARAAHEMADFFQENDFSVLECALYAASGAAATLGTAIVAADRRRQGEAH